jgi:hypothetical protein
VVDFYCGEELAKWLALRQINETRILSYIDTCNRELTVLIARGLLTSFEQCQELSRRYYSTPDQAPKQTPPSFFNSSNPHRALHVFPNWVFSIRCTKPCFFEEKPIAEDFQDQMERKEGKSAPYISCQVSPAWIVNIIQSTNWRQSDRCLDNSNVLFVSENRI